MALASQPRLRLHQPRAARAQSCSRPPTAWSPLRCQRGADSVVISSQEEIGQQGALIITPSAPPTPPPTHLPTPPHPMAGDLMVGHW